MKKVQKPKLRIMVSHWTFSAYPTQEKEWSVSQKIKAVKKAGFDGMSVGMKPPLAEECLKQGLTIMGGTDVALDDDIESKLRTLKELGIQHVNIQLADHDTPTHDALPATIACLPC